MRVLGLHDGMAGWLLRAFVMENVAAHRDGVTLDLPNALGRDAPDRTDVGKLGLTAVEQPVAPPHDVG